MLHWERDRPTPDLMKIKTTHISFKIQITLIKLSFKNKPIDILLAFLMQSLWFELVSFPVQLVPSTAESDSRHAELASLCFDFVSLPSMFVSLSA